MIRQEEKAMQKEQEQKTAGKNEPSPARDTAEHIKQMTEEEIFHKLERAVSEKYILLLSRELLVRLYHQNVELKKKNVELNVRLTALENRKHGGRSGRTRKIFVLNDRELDDDYLMHMVDDDYLTIRELEKEVGATKNTLRNRYERAKRRKAQAALASGTSNGKA